MYIYLPLFVAVIGLLMYLFVDAAKYPKAIEVGRILFWTGMLSFLLTYGRGGGATFSLGK